MPKKKAEAAIQEVEEVAEGTVEAEQIETAQVAEETAIPEVVTEETEVTEEAPKKVEEDKGVKEEKETPAKDLSPYQRVKLVGGPFKGLLGKTLTKVKDSGNWHVEINFGNRPIIQVVAETDIDKL